MKAGIARGGLDGQCLGDDLDASITRLADFASGESQDAPAVQGEQILPLAIACEIRLVLAVPLPAIHLDSKARRRESDVDAIAPAGHGAGMLKTRHARPAGFDGVPQKRLRR